MTKNINGDNVIARNLTCYIIQTSNTTASLRYGDQTVVLDVPVFEVAETIRLSDEDKRPKMIVDIQNEIKHLSNLVGKLRAIHSTLLGTPGEAEVNRSIQKLQHKINEECRRQSHIVGSLMEHVKKESLDANKRIAYDEYLKIVAQNQEILG